MEGGEYFMHGGGVPPPPLHFDPTWQSLSSAMEMQPNELNSSNVPSSADCFFNHPNWEKSTDHQNLHFDSAMSSMVSSPAASNSNLSQENFVIRELIVKLGEISPHSCHTTPMNSPPKLIFPGMEHQLAKENLNFLPSLGKPLGLNSTVAEFTADPGFAERAARFSCFGSRSFNGRTRHLGPSNAELGSRCTPLIPRVSSSPSLKLAESQKENTNSPWQDRSELANSSQESSLSEQVPNGEAAVKVSSELNSRKRKAAPKGKAKESLTTTTPPANAAKVAEIDDNSKAKRSKSSEGKEIENVGEKGKEETKDSGDEKPSKSDSKPPEPPKDYIHVRARRGQATDSHSLAERVRREKISERMKLLQDLVPGCNKVTGKALMLDEIINYVQSLQRQVEFLSMKLSSVNTSLDFNMNTLISKEIFQSNNSWPHPTFPLDSSASAVFGHQPQQNPALHSNIAMDDTRVSHNLDGFNQTVAQYPTFCEDDLQSIVQMGFGQNLNQQASLHLQSFYSPNQETHLKVEL